MNGVLIMNTKQALIALVGEVWEINHYSKYCTVNFGYTDDGIKVEVNNHDENSRCAKIIGGYSVDACLSLLDFLQANTKEGE